MHSLGDTLPRKRLLPEPSLDIVQNLSVRRVRLVEDVLEAEVGWAEPVAEVLGEDPAAVYYVWSRGSGYCGLRVWICFISKYAGINTEGQTPRSIEKERKRTSISRILDRMPGPYRR